MIIIVQSLAMTKRSFRLTRAFSLLTFTRPYGGPQQPRTSLPYGDKGMKLKTTNYSQQASKAKRQREPLREYCDTACQKDRDGNILWPAAHEAILTARGFLKECALSQGKVLIVPYENAGGLAAGVIVHRTLIALGVPSSLIETHLAGKGFDAQISAEILSMEAKKPRYLIVIDQESRAGYPIIDALNTKYLIINHRLYHEFLINLTAVSAYRYPPSPTSALLTYEICKPLHPTIGSSCSHLCVIGIHSDLGNSLNWRASFLDDRSDVYKSYSTRALWEAVTLLDAPRRTVRYDVKSAWKALLEMKDLKEVLGNEILLSARAEVYEEVGKHIYTPPEFSKDGKIAVFRIHSAAQIHPLIAARWARLITSETLEIVLVANTGYLPDVVSFSCRIVRSARARDPTVNIIAFLKAVAARATTDLLQRLGTRFAQGYKHASGSTVPVAEFEELMALMEVDEKPDVLPAKTEDTTGE